MKILIIGDKEHVFIYNLVKWLYKTNSSIELIDVISRKRMKNKTDRYYNKVFFYESFYVYVPLIRRFFKEKSKNTFFKKKIKKVEKKYDIIHIHYIEHRLIENADFLSGNITGKLIVTIWGSDFYRSNKSNRRKMLPILQRADNISFENPEMLEEFAQYYREKYNIEFRKLTVVRFGLAPLEDMELLNLNKDKCKFKLNIPVESITVCIGYNAHLGQQHLEILESLGKINNELHENVYLLLPLTYGGNAEYIEKIIEKANNLKFKFRIFTEFLSNYDIAVLRMASDYFLNLQITDALSGSMLEHLYANNIVITGSWLPYNILSELGIDIVKINHVNQIGKVISELILSGAHYNNKSENRKILYDFSYWGNCIKEWNKLYE